jgi:hypothetical protein
MKASDRPVCARSAPLGAAVISSAQMQALAWSLDQLWLPVSPGRLAAPPPGRRTRRPSPASYDETWPRTSTWATTPLVHRACAAAAAWLDRGAIDRQSPAGSDTVLGQGDSNLANFLWDGCPVLARAPAAPAAIPRSPAIRLDYAGQAARAGGPWLRRVLLPSGLVAVVVPSGCKVMPQPHRCTAIR